MNGHTVTYVNGKGDMVTATATTRWPPVKDERYVGPWSPAALRPKPISRGSSGMHLPLDDNQVTALWFHQLGSIRRWCRQKHNDDIPPKASEEMKREIQRTIKALKKVLKDLEARALEGMPDEQSAIVN